MKNTPIIFLVVIVLVFGGVGVYVLMNKNSGPSSQQMVEQKSLSKEEVMMDDEKKETKTEESIMEQGKKAIEEPGDSTTMSAGKYVEYAPQIFESSANIRRVLFFYANWCPVCKPADASFTQNENKIPPDVTLIRVNYKDTDTDQSEKDLAKKYAV